MLVEKESIASMGRNLYILAGTLGALGLLSLLISLTGIAQTPGSPGDASLWRFTGTVLVFLGLIVALGGVLSTLFEQAERRASVQRENERRRRRAS